MRTFKIGKDVHNDIVVNDDYASRYHCQIMQDDRGCCSIADLGSTNGTFVNGMQVHGQMSLRSTDVVRVGNTTLTWQNYMQQPIREPDGRTSGGGRSTGNGGSPFGITSLSCGAASLIFMWIIGIFAAIPSICAIIFGALSIKRGEPLKGMGIAGLVCGTLVTVFLLIALIIAIVYANAIISALSF